AVGGPVRVALKAPVLWGLAFGAGQAASPLAFWWLHTATVYALGLVLIASVYIGFAIADGRRGVLVVETGVATVFVIARRRGRYRVALAARRRPGRPWVQGPVAAPPSV